MIELRAITAGYGGDAKLHDLSLRFPKGKISALVGPNGCGKSTLIKVAAGLLRPFDGQILINDTPLESIPRNQLARTVAYLPQSRNIPSITVNRLVLHGRFPYLGYPRRYGREDYAIAARAMRWAGVEALSDKNMAALSGGERQKAYLAMALAQDTEVIFLDEPTTYLDIAHQLEVMRLAERLRQAEKTVVMVLHDLNLALRHADVVAVMRGGVLRGMGPPDAVHKSGVLQEVFGVAVGCYREAGDAAQYFFTQA